ncbi:succinate dehydrogenase assembly factor 2 [Psychromonas sp. MME2]|uniref:FAD assembly factor SdhE n=1 Tax=unclassified Psychromonas TaxID=2614957 RepID=UPI00339C9D97
MTEVVNKSRLLWACRRGMLELDVLFMPFVTDTFDCLSDNDKLTLQRLLSCEDPELFAWFMGHKICPDLELSKMINAILQRDKI